MKNRNGFTLAELLGVITLLAIIALITVPLVNKYITSSRQKAYDVEIKTLTKAAENWNVKYSTSIVWNSGGYYALSLDTLKASEFLGEEDIVNPKDPKTEIDGCIMIINDNSKYYYQYSSSCSIDTSVYANGTAVYFNPETGNKCTLAEAISITGTKTGCMKWYTFGDTLSTSITVNLILDHNTTPVVAYNSTNVNTSMKELATALTNDTSSWLTTLSPRLITANEIATITGNTSWTAASSWFFYESLTTTRPATCMLGNTTGCRFGWLFDRTSKTCTNYGCSTNADSSATLSGYWTSTKYTSNVTIAWMADSSGGLMSHYVNDAVAAGVRPVITVSKYAIK